MDILGQLKQINWKRHLHTTSMVLIDFKVLALLALSVMTAYGIGWDTVVRPSLEGLQGRDNAIKEQNDTLEKKQQLQHEYGDLEQRLSSLDTHMLALHEGTSTKIVSVTEAAELIDIASGKLRASNLPTLQPPHNVREHVDLKPLDSTTIDILHPNDTGGNAAPSPAPAPENDPKRALGGSSRAEEQATNAPMPVERYNYELSVTGTYPALMDLLNQLVTRKKLIKINKITVTKSTYETGDPPDAKDFPDYPLKLDMVISLSMFLYEDNNAPTGQ